MATFTVDPATLQELSSTLSGIHSEMGQMHTVATGFEGLLGGSDIEGEVEHFASTWNYGISQLGKDMEEVVQRLTAAASGYGKSETDIENACKGGK